MNYNLSQLTGVNRDVQSDARTFFALISVSFHYNFHKIFFYAYFVITASETDVPSVKFNTVWNAYYFLKILMHQYEYYYYMMFNILFILQIDFSSIFLWKMVSVFVDFFRSVRNPRILSKGNNIQVRFCLWE